MPGELNSATADPHCFLLVAFYTATQIEHAARQFGQQTRYAPQQIGS
jgi:hypothetical protein